MCVNVNEVASPEESVGYVGFGFIGIASCLMSVSKYPKLDLLQKL